MSFGDDVRDRFDPADPLRALRERAANVSKGPTKTPRLTTKQLAAIAEMLGGKTREQAAAAVGVNRRQLYRWWELPHFREEYRRAASRALAVSAGRVRVLSEQATKALENALKSKSASVRVAAATALWKLATTIESDEINDRLDALERRDDEG